LGLVRVEQVATGMGLPGTLDFWCAILCRIRMRTVAKSTADPTFRDMRRVKAIRLSPIGA